MDLTAYILCMVAATGLAMLALVIGLPIVWLAGVLPRGVAWEGLRPKV